MSRWLSIQMIVEGMTEQKFANEVLADYLALHNITVCATQVSKPQQKGGDVRFERAKIDVLKFLRQRRDTIICTFVDYYGLNQWPGLESIQASMTPERIANLLTERAVSVLEKEFSDLRVRERYIPFIAMHEFEALLFSDTSVLAAELGIDKQQFDAVLDECGSPEHINNTRETSPSHRLLSLSYGRFKKTYSGIRIANRIGIDKMRSMCPLFDSWIGRLIALAEGS